MNILLQAQGISLTNQSACLKYVFLLYSTVHSLFLQSSNNDVNIVQISLWRYTG